ncbi:exodeoxyribonuclease VII large subunit [Neisseria shayeganii]|uniref:Exodeoxyribonuclease 7 large subunit n=1 Tax=Neisseria shayeganii TaxID=607712 RepID=A0A7D7SR48_9NEIS|nr:exodeoxyribonuclease VII large subunit [Neisseria shayeganii]QMT41630.1 exodeoxyribonuclease VII large subunit [Neisseria shayeganii]
MPELSAPAALSVSELNALAKNLLEQHLFGLWIAGEVSNLTKAASGHYYFSLKDQQAQVRCTLFKYAAQRLAAPLKEGDHIELSGRITLYEARGEFQINVSDVRHKGLGQLFEAYERLKQRLQAEGLFDPAKKRPLPAHPQCIGIVTSLAAAALRDVVSTLRRRAPAIPVVVYPTAVQGAGSEFQVAAAIEAAARHGAADVLIVCRGGGSIEDLWAFNEEAAVRAVAASPIPIVSGVGHETDFTLTDFAADLRAPTPTAAAELVSPNRLELINRLAHIRRQQQQMLLRRYADAAQKLDWAAQRLRHPRQQIQEQRIWLQNCRNQLQQAARRHWQGRQEKLAYLANVHRLYRPAPESAHQQLVRQQQQLKHQFATLLQQRLASLQEQQALLSALSPQHILARGYSVVSDRHGKVVRDAHRLRPGQMLHIRFAHGATEARVAPQAAGQADLFD